MSRPRSAATPPSISSPSPEIKAAVREAGLRYVSDRSPGITRATKGRRTRFVDAAGRVVRDAATLGRIRQLAIPPAWTEVWICPLPHGHLQATGRDLRRRKQYLYHPEWNATRDVTKFERMMAFGRALPRIRRRVARDLRRRGFGREKVVAAVVRLLEGTLIRVGNEEYVRQNQSFGLTTLRHRHVSFRRGTMHFHFPGKSGRVHDIDLHDPRLARLVQQLQDLPGQELFHFVAADGSVQKVCSEDINAYLHEVAGATFSAKDFRTWSGTVLAALALQEAARAEDARPTKRALKAAIARVAQRLGNTPAICRKCYIHPAVMDGYLAGETMEVMRAGGEAPAVRVSPRLAAEESALLVYLKKRTAAGS